MQRLSAENGHRFAHFYQRFHFGALGWSELAFIVAVHQLLQTSIGFSRQPEPAYRFNPVYWGGNKSAHSIRSPRKQ
jgi:hypothetical protein